MSVLAILTALCLNFCLGFWLGRRLLRGRTRAAALPHEWAAFGQGGNVHASASFRPDPQGGHAYRPAQPLPQIAPGRIYLHSPQGCGRDSPPDGPPPLPRRLSWR